MNYTQEQTRVIGCLIEKSITTPDQYPLSLNALTNACNQKSNRDPVMALSEGDVQSAVDELSKLRVVSDVSSFGSRVSKYQHRFCNTEFGDLQLSEGELAIVCLMFLRGPQTPGELRTRSNRLAKFADVSEVEAALSDMAERSPALVVKLPREAGKRESRYAHCFSGEIDLDAIASSAPAPSASAPSVEWIDRIEALEARVAELERQLGVNQD
ncbi:YceH family protein [Paraferrimonas sedimenticola]